jgi:hypothetical protein
MSDGITESRRGTYFSNKNKKEKYPITPQRKLQIKINKLNKFFIYHIPNLGLKRVISLVKSIIRILGYSILPFSLEYSIGVLIFSEILGILEELV